MLLGQKRNNERKRKSLIFHDIIPLFFDKRNSAKFLVPNGTLKMIDGSGKVVEEQNKLLGDIKCYNFVAEVNRGKEEELIEGIES